MSPEPAPIPYRQIVTELATLCGAGRTGTLFMATTDNQSARIGLTQGEITSLVFRNQRGFEAVDHLRKIAAARISFSDAVMDRGVRDDLPATPDLLELLGTDESPAVAPTRPEAAPPPSRALASPASPPPASSADPQLTRVRAVIEAELIEYLGPMAVVICREHIARAAAANPPHDVRQIVEALAREIGDRAKEERFRQQVLAKLRDR